MRSHNKRQLDSIFNFLWFDQQSFKIKASYNKNNSVHQHQFNMQIIQRFFHFNECDTKKSFLTILAVVLFWGRDKSQDFPVNVWQRLGVL